MMTGCLKCGLPVLLDGTHRPHKIYRYRLGDTGSREVYHDPDGRFFVHCYRTSSERQLVILSHSKTTSEAWVLSADEPEGQWTCLAPRQEDHEYFPDHGLHQRSEEHTSVLQSLMRISYAVFCL